MLQDENHQPLHGTSWTNVDLDGSVGEKDEFRPQDDFHAAINRDWLIQATIEEGNTSESAFWERMRQVQTQVEDLLADNSITGHEADLVHALYNALLDTDAREAAGVEPLRSTVEEIRAISNLDALTAFLCTNHDVPVSMLCSSGPFADKKESRNNVVYVDHGGFSLGNADEYREMSEMGQRMRAADRSYHVKMLMRFGISEDEALAIDDHLFALETKIAEVCLGSSDLARDDIEELTYNPRTAQELSEASPAFPLMHILEKRRHHQSYKFVLEEPAWLERINQVYVPENLEGFKAMLLCNVAHRYGTLLDKQAYDDAAVWRQERVGTVGIKPLSRSAYEYCNDLLGMAVGKMYVDRYLAPQVKTRVEELISQVIGTYHQRLANAPWLSADTAQAACEKLDALTPRVGYPKSWPEYSKLQFMPKDGPVQMYAAVNRFERDRDAEKVNQPVDREEWLMNPHEVNAYYLPTDNSINIPAGILGGVFFAEDAGPEEMMGAIGVVIGHEITHAFDKNGSLYDKDGNLGNSWWSDEDRAAFKARTDEVAQYWNNIEVLPGQNVDGDLCVTEIVADLGGVACMTQIGHSLPEFDFAKMYEAYARVWRIQESREICEYLILNDVHAPAHLRTNGTVQMMDEFHTAFEVKPGDGMYLPPEMRLKVW